MFFRYWYCNQADCYNHHARDGEEDDSEVKVVDTSQDGRSQVHLTAAGMAVGELQDHAGQSSSETNNQTPEGTLRHTHS